MKTDSLSYRFFREFPEFFFELLGRPSSDAERYRFDAIEFKDTAVRIDGVYSPASPDDREPVFLVEYQNHRSERAYSNLMLKIGMYLEKVNPRQDWHAVMIYPNRSTEQENLHPYRGLLQLPQVSRIYLEDLAGAPASQFGFGILRMLASKPKEAVELARQMIPAVRTSNEVAVRQRQLIQFIETVVSYQWPQLPREELEKMLQVTDFRETRVYQEALEEGIEKGIEKGIERVAIRMLDQGVDVKKIAEQTGLSAAAVKRLKRKPRA